MLVESITDIDHHLTRSWQKRPHQMMVYIVYEFRLRVNYKFDQEDLLCLFDVLQFQLYPNVVWLL